MITKLEFRRSSAFSLIELMVAMGVLAILMLMLTVVLDQVQRGWRFSESRVTQFREARVAFDVMAKNIGQASLNTYWSLRDGDGDGIADGYFRTSELQFLTVGADDLDSTGSQNPVGQGVFFQAPLGFSTEYRNLNNLFNGRGYFVAFGSDRKFKPSFVEAEERFRYRLMEFRPPAESNQVFEDGGEERVKDQPQSFTKWYKQAMSVGDGDFESHLNPLAENILAIVVTPRASLEIDTASREDTFSDIAPDYEFNSNSGDSNTNPFAQQVPPLVRVTMIAIDEAAATRLITGSSQPEELRRVVSGKFTNTRNYSADVQAVSSDLNALNVSHKVFSALVMLRSAKWSG